MKLKKAGFTLIELMIVVAIIGILAAVAVPKFADLVTKSKEASVKGNLGAVRSAVSIYYGDTEGVYPTNLFDGLATNGRYMPSISGTASLGNFEIPKNSNNVGHTTAGTFKNVTQAGVIQGTGTPTDATGLYYVSTTGGREGEVFVNCTHVDSKSAQWTSY